MRADRWQRWQRMCLWVFISLAAIACQSSCAPRPFNRDQAQFAAAAWNVGLSAEDAGRTLQHTSPPLTVQLDPATRLTIPPHLAHQEIVGFQRLYALGPSLPEAVLVGLNCRDARQLNQAYALVYAKQEGQLTLVAELPLRERFERFDQAWVNRDEPVLIIYGNSGTHFTDLFVYRFTGAQPELLFANGSAAGAEVRHDITLSSTTIWIGVENWSDPQWDYAHGKRLWNVYTWNGREFVYNEQLSTVRETSVEERVRMFTGRVLHEAERLAQEDAKPVPGAKGTR